MSTICGKFTGFPAVTDCADDSTVAPSTFELAVSKKTNVFDVPELFAEDSCFPEADVKVRSDPLVASVKSVPVIVTSARTLLPPVTVA